MMMPSPFRKKNGALWSPFGTSELGGAVRKASLAPLHASRPASARNELARSACELCCARA
eukprot:5785651-Prymnesium_polylepis.1